MKTFELFKDNFYKKYKQYPTIEPFLLKSLNAAVFDDFQFKRVVKNLIQNAVSFSPDNSEIKINTELNDKKIIISITNKGAGISSEDLELIFQKYYSGHSKFRKAGTGLGLYLSQKIMTAHNGNIKVDNENKDSTTFILELPIN